MWFLTGLRFLTLRRSAFLRVFQFIEFLRNFLFGCCHRWQCLLTRLRIFERFFSGWNFFLSGFRDLFAEFGKFFASFVAQTLFVSRSTLGIFGSTLDVLRDLCLLFRCVGRFGIFQGLSSILSRDLCSGFRLFCGLCSGVRFLRGLLRLLC